MSIHLKCFVVSFDGVLSFAFVFHFKTKNEKALYQYILFFFNDQPHEKLLLLYNSVQTTPKFVFSLTSLLLWQIQSNFLLD